MWQTECHQPTIWGWCIQPIIMVIWEMVDYWVYHIIGHDLMERLFIISIVCPTAEDRKLCR